MTPAQIAATFAAARRTATALDTFPGGTPPATLEDAYAIQLEAIAAWPDEIVGWKAGRITGDLERATGIDRFLGPIFRKTLALAAEAPTQFPVFVGGFGAFEIEVAALVGRDLPAANAPITAQSVRPAIASLHIGVELAGSPLTPINDLGPLASIAGFGNNNGLIVGPEIADGLARPDRGFRALAHVDGQLVGAGEASRLPGGVWQAVAFAFETARSLGLPLREGQWIATGALTGVHAVTPGQVCKADFLDDGTIHCTTVAITPTNA